MGILPDGTAELVLPNIHDGVDVLYPCFYIQGREIITIPYFKLGLKMENEIFYSKRDPPNLMNFKLKKGFCNIENIKSYIISAFNTRVLEVERDSVSSDQDPKFDTFKITLDDEEGKKDVSVVRDLLGFKGQYYSIPYANCDF